VVTVAESLDERRVGAGAEAETRNIRLRFQRRGPGRDVIILDQPVCVTVVQPESTRGMRCPGGGPASVAIRWRPSQPTVWRLIDLRQGLDDFGRDSRQMRRFSSFQTLTWPTDTRI
jgi:hypothetical protein